MRTIFSGLLVACLLFLVPSVSHAAYVLPYPSYMPGNKLYKVSRVVDIAKGWWSWGTIASLKYHMALSDKYLVEAKILFEYGQYLLAFDALTRSDEHARQIKPLIAQGAEEGKDMTRFDALVAEAMTVHMSILDKIRESTPATFLWQPERAKEIHLSIHDRLEQSYVIR